MQPNKTCLKIDKPNAYAMIVGYCKDGKLNQQSIWLTTAGSMTDFPKLLTLQKTMSYKLSPIGKEIDAKNFDMPLKYIAALYSQYFIENKMELWEKICFNGLFDIWDPKGGPYKRFAQAAISKIPEFRIQLLRIYEIDHEFNFNNGELKHAGDIFDQLIPPIPEVNIIRPVITEEKFRELKELLEDSVAPYRTRPPQYFVSAPEKTPLTIDSEDIKLLELEEGEFSEGRLITRSHKLHERKPLPSMNKKKKVLENTGKLACEVCGFDFHTTYGELGRNFAECHHLVPLSELTESKHTRPEDLAIVCANCHRMLHKASPLKTIEELKNIIGGN
jgi:hypothetical protein